VQVRLLGEIAVVGGDRAVALGGPRQRRTLAALAIRRGEVVSISSLVDALWPDGDPPGRAGHDVRTYVHRLRLALSDDGGRIETVGAGYRLRLDGDDLDVTRFERFADVAVRAAEAGDAAGALLHVDRAQREWREPPLGEFEHESWAMPTAVRLRERNASLRECRAAALIELGRASEAVETLAALVHDEPLRERPRALLMKALYDTGRQAEALRAFRDFRRFLADETGVEPSEAIVALDRAIACGDVGTVDTRQRRRVGEYELRERVGEGMFAIVHRAIQPSLRREVAVKVIRAEFANRPDFIRRFEAEAQMVARIEHSNIVPLYDFWREPDRACVAMRWMAGGSLQRRLGSQWSLESTLTLVDEIAAALEAAHRHGVVHRDVKPGNILFDADDRASLADFGIALDTGRAPAADSPLSNHSAGFAAPEQLMGGPVGPPADVHSLAMVAFTMLTGRSPFADSANATVLLDRQLHETLPAVRMSRPDVPARIDDVLAIATAKRPGDRYSSAEAFAAALRGLTPGISPAVSRIRSGRPANPFKGLDAFSEADVGDFHGRDRLVGELIARLDACDVRALAVVGPSGSGKSSLVRAGLIPAVRSGRANGSARWFVTTMTPGDRPFESLEAALLRVAVNPPPSLVEQVRDGDRGVVRGIRRIVPDDDGVVLLFVDQFEELFATSVGDAERDAFLSALAVAATDPATPLRLVVALRADFYDRPLRHATFAPIVDRGTVAIGPLSPDEIERAIVEPAAAVGVGFESGLVAEIVADVTANPGALPLMQYALRAAFERRDAESISLEAYRSVGGLSGALAQRAEEIWGAATSEEQIVARRLFGRLVTFGDGREDTRRRVERGELGDDTATVTMIERFGAARLLSFDRDTASREPTVEVAHEAVLRAWPRLRAWLDEDRDALRAHRHLTTAAAGWVERGRDRAELYRGARLQAAESLLANPVIAVNEDEAEFLAASVTQRASDEAAARRRARHRWYVTAAIAAVAAVALVATVVAVRQRDRADAEATAARRNAALAADSAALAERRAGESDEARQEAEQERARADDAAAAADDARVAAEDTAAAADRQRLEVQAVALVDEDPGLAALLAVEAYRAGRSVTSAGALHQVLTGTDGIEAILPGSNTAGMLSDDGVTLVTTSPTRLEVWDLPTRTLTHHEDFAFFDSILDVAAEDRLVAYSNSKSTSLLDVATGVRKEVPAGEVDWLALSPDGTELAVVGPGGLQRWDVAGEPMLVEQRAVEGGAIDVAWSPTGDGYAVVTGTAAVQYRRRDAPVPVWTFEPTVGSNGNLGSSSMLFASDGQSFVVANGEQQGSGVIVRTYATADGTVLRPPISTVHDPNAMIWTDEDGGLIASTSMQQGTIAFDLVSGTEVPPPVGVPNANSIGYSAALDRYTTTSTSRGVEIRRPAGSGPLERVVELPPAHRDAITAGGVIYASVAPADRLVAAVFQLQLQPETVIFDLTADPPTWERFEFQGLPTGAGRQMLMTYWDSSVVLGPDLAPLGTPVTTPPDTRMFRPSPDGRYFAVSRFNGAVNLYRSSGELIGELRVPDAVPSDGLVFTSFSPDGSRLMTFTTTNAVWAMWETATGALVDNGPYDELLLPRFGGGTLYAERSIDDFTVLQLDPVTYEQVGPPLVGSRVPVGSYVEDGAGELVARSDFEGTTRVFDKATGIQLGREITGIGRNPDSEFAADGTTLMTIAGDHVSLWNYDIDSWEGIACALAGRNLTQAEWDEVGPRTIDYRATCPQYPIDT
jgi:serine/threonine protein kinase